MAYTVFIHSPYITYKTKILSYYKINYHSTRFAIHIKLSNFTVTIVSFPYKFPEFLICEIDL